MEKSGVKIAAQNRKAYHDYFVEDRYEAGIELFGTEVKSIRAGTLNLKDSYCVAKDGEIYAHSLHISPYDTAISSTATRIGPSACCSTSGRYASSTTCRSRTDTPSSPCPSTSRTPASRWSWACARARRITTSGTPWPSGTPGGRWTEPCGRRTCAETVPP